MLKARFGTGRGGGDMERGRCSICRAQPRFEGLDENNMDRFHHAFIKEDFHRLIFPGAGD